MADYKKSITFQAKLDTSEIGPSIETLKQRLGEVAGSVNRVKSQVQTTARLSQQGYVGTMASPGQEERQKAKAQLSAFVQEQSQAQERLYREIEGQKNKMERLQKVQNSKRPDSKEWAAAGEKRKVAREVLSRLEGEFKDRNTVINQSMDLQSGRISGKTDKASEAYIKEQNTLQGDLSKNIDMQKFKLGVLETRKKAPLQSEREELAIDKEILKVKKEIQALEKEHQERETKINNAKETWGENHIEAPAAGGMGSGMGGGKTPTGATPPTPGGDNEIPKDFSKAMDSETARIGGSKMGGPGGGAGVGLGMLTKALGTAITVMGSVGSVYQQFKELPMERAIATGSATQGLLGEQLQGIGRGDVVNQMAWLPERKKAMEMATGINQAKDVTDQAKMVGGGLVGGIGKGLGVKIGDENLWNLLAGSAISSLKEALPTNKSDFGKFIDKKLSSISEEYLSTYQATRMKEYVENYQNIANAEIKKNPLKDLAAQRLQQNYMPDLQTQRMMGLSDDKFFGKGGFQEKANKSGFNAELARTMSTQIEAAGGSTRGMKDLSVLGLQAQKGFDLTNAGSVLGKISGGAGSSQASEQIFRKLMEESIKAGLDKSDFREEQRKYAEMTSEILAQSGVKTAEDSEKVLKGFSKYLGENPTIRELQGAKSAYEEAQGFSAETSGRGGALQFAAMLKHPSLKALGAKGMAGLMEMPDKDLLPSNPYVIAEASKADVSPEQLIKDAKEAKLEKQYTEVGLDKKQTASLNKYLTDKGLNKKDLTTKDLDKMKEEAPEEYAQYINVQEAPSIRSAYEGTQKRQAVVRGLIAGEAPGEEKDIPKFFGRPIRESAGAEYDRGIKGDTGRSGDAVVAASGVAAQAMLENFREFKNEITPTATALEFFTKKIVLLQQVLNATPDIDKASTQRWMSEHLFDNVGKSTQNQGQGGKPSR